MIALRSIATALLLALVAISPARADLSFPAFSNYVVDDANVLPVGDEQALISKLKAFQERSGHQFAAATVPSLQGTSVEDFANRLFRQWGLGDKTRNDGVLLLVAPSERKVRIEVGYGLEGDLTDLVSHMIIQNAILPRFKAGDLPGGVNRGVDDVIAVFSGQAEEYKQRALESLSAKEYAPWWVDVIILFVMIAVFAFIFWVFWQALKSTGRSGGRRSGPWIVGGPSSGGGWSSGSSDSGGFSGGGGGSSGGGGASGGW